MTEKYYLVVEVSGDLAKIHDNISEDNIMDVNEAVDKLNELYDENQEVFDAIDNRLRYYQEFLENEKRNGRDIMLLQRIVDDLKDLKRLKSEMDN